MKRISALLFCLMAPTFAFAQAVTGSVALEGSGAMTIDQCGLLNENVNITLSAGVNAGLDCSPTRVAIGTCHTAGRTVSRQVNGRPIPLGCGVPGEDGTTVTCTGFERVTASGAAVAVATTLQGTVFSEYPGDTCSAATALATAAEQD